MKVSLIIAIYKDVQALEIIFESLLYQTYKDFEVIVAEDGESTEVSEFINNANKYNFEIVHTTQEDIAVRKSQSQNNGIRAASGEYLIFIDGDCILYSDFIKNHLALSGENKIITGRRVNLGPRYSKQLREKTISPLELENNFIKKYSDIKEDAKVERHSEEGFTIKVNGFIHTLFKLFRKKEPTLLGCNMSFYKKAMYEINGFDEELGNAAVASDTDLTWRFKGLGYKIVSVKFIANQFHLYHKRSEDEYERGLVELMTHNQNNKKYICTQGLV